MKLLLISNSTNAGEEYLRYPLPEIGRFLDGVRELVFVPYAAVTFSYAAYEAKVQARLAELGIRAEHALALPGKCAPRTAGTLIAQTVLAILEERGSLHDEQ